MARKNSNEGSLLFGLAVLVIAVLAYPSLANVSPRPPANAPDLLPAFRDNTDTSEARGHARSMASLLGAFADQIEWDGQRRNAAGELAPRLTTGVQVFEFEWITREFATRGWSFAKKYPQLGTKIHDHMANAVGTKGGKITDEQRAAWCKSLRELQSSCAYAAGAL